MLKVYVLTVVSLLSGGDEGPTQKSQIVREYPTNEECVANIDKYSYFVRENENYIRCIPMYRKKTNKDL